MPTWSTPSPSIDVGSSKRSATISPPRNRLQRRSSPTPSPPPSRCMSSRREQTRRAGARSNPLLPRAPSPLGFGRQARIQCRRFPERELVRDTHRYCIARELRRGITAWVPGLGSTADEQGLISRLRPLAVLQAPERHQHRPGREFARPRLLGQVSQIPARALDHAAALHDRCKRHARLLRAHRFDRLGPGAWADARGAPDGLGDADEIPPARDAVARKHHEVRTSLENHAQGKRSLRRALRLRLVRRASALAFLKAWFRFIFCFWF